MKRDLSNVDNTVCNWILKHSDDINKVYHDKEKLLQLLVNVKEECSVSDAWFNSFIYKIKEMNPNQTIYYIYNSYLKGCNLGADNDKKESSRR